MSFQNLTSNIGLLQSFLTGAGLFAPDKETSKFFGTLRWHIIAMIVLGAVGIVFLLVGLCLYLMTIMQPYMVFMIMGGVIFALGLIVLASRIFVFFMIKRKVKNALINLYKDVQNAVEEMLTELKQPITENPQTAVITAAIVGFVLARKFIK